MDREHPSSFVCPVFQDIMRDPVVLVDGHSYERQAIKKWLQDHDTSPLTGSRLPSKDVISNMALRGAITEYFQRDLKCLRSVCPRRESLPADFKMEACGTFLEEAVGSLVQTTTAMHSDKSVSGLLHLMMEAKVLLGAEMSSIFLPDRQEGILKSQINSTGSELRFPIASCIMGHVLTSGEPLLVRDAYSDSRFNSDMDRLTGFISKNMIFVPLKDNTGRILGVVELINKTSGGATCAADDGCFTGADLHFLQIFASEAAEALVRSGLLLDSTEACNKIRVESIDSCTLKIPDVLDDTAIEQDDEVANGRLERIDTPEFWPVDTQIFAAEMAKALARSGHLLASTETSKINRVASVDSYTFEIPVAQENTAIEQDDEVVDGRLERIDTANLFEGCPALVTWWTGSLSSSSSCSPRSLGCSSAFIPNYAPFGCPSEHLGSAAHVPNESAADVHEKHKMVTGSSSLSLSYSSGSLGCSSAFVPNYAALGCSSKHLGSSAPVPNESAADVDEEHEPKAPKREGGRTRQRRAQAIRKRVFGRGRAPSV